MRSALNAGSSGILWHFRRIEDSVDMLSRCAEYGVREFVIESRNERVLRLIDGREIDDFMSCSYLGLDTDPRLIDAMSASSKKFGVQISAARTRIRPQSLDQLEDELSQIFCNRAVVIFPNLHCTHQGVLPLLASGVLPSFPFAANGPTFLLDRTAHASIQCNRLELHQFGITKRVDCNDLANLEEEFKGASQAKRSPVVLLDSVGSMGGLASIQRICDLAEMYDGYVYADDAHGTSIFGERGEGHVLYQKQIKSPHRLLVSSSLSKAFGAPGGGAISLPTSADADFVKRYATTYIFGGPLGIPFIDIARASSKIHLSSEVGVLQDKLRSNISHFDSLNERLEITNHGKHTPIRGLTFKSVESGLLAAKQLVESGIGITFATYPVVAQRTSVIRIALAANHTADQIRKISTAINSLEVQNV